jgi:hypothetical protein
MTSLSQFLSQPVGLEFTFTGLIISMIVIGFIVYKSNPKH